MVKHRLLYISVIFCICISGFLEAQATQTVRELTIDEAVKVALENNLGLQQSAINLNGKKRASDRSWNSLIPSISAGAVASHPTSITGSLFPAQDSWTTGFQVSASLSLSVVTIDNIKRAKADYEAGAISYEQAKQELEIQVRKLFYQIILLNANKELAALSLENTQSRYAQSASLARAGQAAHLDELSARVDMENKRPVLRNAEMAYENAIDSFKTLLGISVEQSITLAGSLVITDNISPVNGRNLNAQGDSLEASAILKSIETLEIQRSATRNSAYIPSLRLSWNSTPLYINEEWRDNSGSFSVTLSMSLDNLLPWSNTKTQIDSINDSISLAQIRLNESLRNRENKITQLLRTIDKTGETIEILTLNVELARTTYDLYVEAYRNGAMDYQRLRDAADSLLQAQNQVRQEQYNHISAILDLEKELNIPYGTLQ
ncbi:MAG: TolC family protein [Treponema sp.]|jgi:outer membrane protein TolC|nr:TolC family protein [Treponema sp.]